MKKEHLNTGNSNAAKADQDKALSSINCRVKQRDKAGWVKQAQVEKMKLTEWIVKTLNDNSAF